jgi:hypothetical protein
VPGEVHPPGTFLAVTNQVQGVDYSRLTALLIEAVKTEQAEIRQLKARLDALTSKAQQ